MRATARVSAVPREDVVRGHQHHIVPLGELETVVVRADVPKVLAVNEYRDAWVLVREMPRNGHAVVGRGIVHDQHVDIEPILIENAVDSVRKIVAVSIARDDHRHGGSSGKGSRPMRRRCWRSVH